MGFGDEMSGYNEQRYLLTSTYMPLRVSLTDASKEKPYISLSLKFSMDEIYEVLKNVEIKKENMQKSQRGIFFGDITEEILEPVLRFILLLEKPKEKIKFLSDLAKKEILYTLVTSDKSGYFLSKFAMQGSVSNKISKAVAKIKNEFTQKLNMKEVARACDMSESSLYHNFKVVTSLTPIAFQKKIRLEEAKNLLATKNIGVAQAAFDVGYESASQFSHVYTSVFGMPPKIHSVILRSGVV